MTREEIERMEAGPKLDALVANFVEPMPKRETARDLRKLEGSNFAWVSNYYVYSPGGWWRAEIGTNCNLDTHGNFIPELDNALVNWRPAKEPSTDMESALLAWDKVNIFPKVCDSRFGNFEITFGKYFATAETFQIAVCRAILIATLPD